VIPLISHILDRWFQDQKPRAPQAEASLVSGAGAISAIEKALRWSSSVALLAGCHGLRGAGGFTHGSGRERAEHVFSR